MRSRLLACVFCLGAFLMGGGTAGAAGFGQNPAMPAYGLFPADQFVVTSGACPDCTALPQALWYFRDETIAVPKPGMPLAGFEPALAGTGRPGRLGDAQSAERHDRISPADLAGGAGCRGRRATRRRWPDAARRRARTEPATGAQAGAERFLVRCEQRRLLSRSTAQNARKSTGWEFRCAHLLAAGFPAARSAGEY